jgi:hypothetical protein
MIDRLSYQKGLPVLLTRWRMCSLLLSPLKHTNKDTVGCRPSGWESRQVCVRNADYMNVICR